MRTIVSILVAAAAILCTSPVRASEVIPDVEYVTGKAGFKDKVKGNLALDAAEVKFENGKGKVIFSIPIGQLVNASANRERSEGSFGRKMALGIFASKTEEYLQVETRSAEGAEVIIFKTHKKQAAGIAAKINFQRDQAPKP
jgi:hypothetical protein